MRQLKHTPEPWHYCDGGVFGEWDDEKDESPLTADIPHCGINGDRTDEGLANAYRIVACVNACKGISTDRLEKMVPGTLANLLTLKGEK